MFEKSRAKNILLVGSETLCESCKYHVKYDHKTYRHLFGYISFKDMLFPNYCSWKDCNTLFRKVKCDDFTEREEQIKS